MGIPINRDTLYERSLKLLEERAQNVNPNNFTIVFMGDGWVGEGYTSEQMFEQALREAKNQDPVCIFHGGDAIFRGGNAQPPIQEKFTRFLEMVNNFAGGIPMFVVPGNHDSERADAPSFENFETFIGPRRFEVVNNRLHFKLVGLDTSWRPSSEGNEYYLSDETLDFLEQSLRSRKRYNFVLNHVAPYAGKWRYTFENQDSTFREGVFRFLRAIHRKVSQVFVSHVHLYDTTIIDHIRYILSGGAGAALVKNQKFHIIVVRVRNGRMTHQVIPVGWTA